MVASPVRDIGPRRGKQARSVAQGIETGEVDGRAKACAQCTWQRAPPEVPDGVWPAGYRLDGAKQRAGPRLLDTRLEEVGRLEEDCRQDARVQAGKEVDCAHVRGLGGAWLDTALTVGRRALSAI